MKGVRKARGGTWRPARASLTGGEGNDSGDGDRRAYKSNAEALLEIAAIERGEAFVRQKEAGIEKPARTNFARDLDPEKEWAMGRIWLAGPRSKQLYIKISKGLATLSWPDVFELAARDDIEALAGGLTGGMTLAEALTHVEEKRHS
jgi:hypothetical protein